MWSQPAQSFLLWEVFPLLLRRASVLCVPFRGSSHANDPSITVMWQEEGFAAVESALRVHCPRSDASCHWY